MCGPEKSEGPVRRDALELRPRKHRRACWQGSIRCVAPKSPKGLFAGTQSRCGPANSAGPVVREAYDVRRRKVRMACSRTNSNAILQPELQLQPKRQFAAQTPIRCRTPVCNPNTNLQPKRQFAAQTPIRSRLPVCSPNASIHT